MKNSAVGRAPSTSTLWPTACPWCGAHDLAYQYEDGAHDVYQCQAGSKWALVRDKENAFLTQSREIRRLSR